MPRDDGDRLLLLTLTLEAALESEDWTEAEILLQSRASLIDSISGLPQSLAAELARAEERMLNSLRARLAGVRADIRKLNAALRIASSYTKNRGSSTDTLSLTG